MSNYEIVKKCDENITYAEISIKYLIDHDRKDIKIEIEKQIDPHIYDVKYGTGYINEINYCYICYEIIIKI